MCGIKYSNLNVMCFAIDIIPLSKVVVVDMYVSHLCFTCCPEIPVIRFLWSRLIGDCLLIERVSLWMLTCYNDIFALLNTISYQHYLWLKQINYHIHRFVIIVIAISTFTMYILSVGNCSYIRFVCLFLLLMLVMWFYFCISKITNTGLTFNMMHAVVTFLYI